MANTIAIVLKGYPRLSESFIAQEILSLEKAGLKLMLISMRHPTDGKVHPVHREIRSPVRYLPEYLHDEPWRVFKAFIRLPVLLTRPAKRLPQIIHRHTVAPSTSGAGTCQRVHSSNRHQHRYY